MRFTKDNNIVYYLDHEKKYGIPSNIDFKVNVLTETAFILTGIDYGMCSPDYGKGPIMLIPSDLERQYLMEKIVEQETTKQVDPIVIPPIPIIMVIGGKVLRIENSSDGYVGRCGGHKSIGDTVEVVYTNLINKIKLDSKNA